MKKLVSLLLCVCLACGLTVTAFAADIAEPAAGSSTTPAYPSGNYSYYSNWKTLATTSANYFDAVIGSFRSLVSALSNIYTAVDSVETYLSDIRSYTSNISTIKTYVSSLNTTVSGFPAKLTSIDNSLTTIKTNTSGQALKLTDIKLDVSSIKTAVQNISTDGLATEAKQDTLNNKVATAQNQVLLKNIVQSFADLFTDGYNSYTFYAGNDEWQNDVSWASGSFTDSFNSTSYSIIEGIRSIANVVASPEDKVFSDSMQSTETKQDLSSFKTTYGDNSNGDALEFGTTLISSMQFMDSGTAMGSIQAVLGGGDSEPWAWFSQATADDLDSAGGAAAVSTFALDSDSDSAAVAPPDDIVYFIDPDLNSADFLKQVQEAHK